jgi:hypothetical protein
MSRNSFGYIPWQLALPCFVASIGLASCDGEGAGADGTDEMVGGNGAEPAAGGKGATGGGGAESDAGSNVKGSAGSGDASAGGSGDGEATSLALRYPSWPDPGADTQTERGEPTIEEAFAGNNDAYVCTSQTYDVTKSFDRVLGLGAQHATAKPGMLVQGRGVLEGQFLPVPLRRSPITISVDLPLTQASRHIENPSLDTIQQAISDLQRDIDAEVEVLRSSFTHSLQLVESSEDASLYFGVDLSFSAPLWSAGLKSTFSSTRTLDTHYLAVKHIEELYTITFSDDLIATETDFLHPGVTPELIRQLEEDGVLGDENPPTYVKSITYGRIVLATAKIVEQLDTRELELIVSANGFGFDGDVEYETRYQQLASSLDFKVLALGASTAEAAAALSQAKIEDMFGEARATTAVPLYYTLNFVRSPRRPAKIGSTTTYTTQECVPTGSKRPCARQCPVGWVDSGTQCASPDGAALGTVVVRSYGGSTTEATPLGAVFPVTDAEALATTAKACATAVYNNGGIWNNPNEVGYTMGCGNNARIVNRSEAWAWKTPQTFCWDVPAGDKCGVLSTGGGNWTPGGQDDGQNTVTFAVQQFYRPYFEAGDPRCY